MKKGIKTIVVAFAMLSLALLSGLTDNVLAASQDELSTLPSESEGTLDMLLASVSPTVTVTLEGGERPFPGYKIPLTLRLYDDETELTYENILTETFLYEYTTDNGAIEITDIEMDNHLLECAVAWDCADDIYNITLTSPYHLINLKNDVEIYAEQSLYMGELLAGNANNDRSINGSDYSIILNDFGEYPGEGSWNRGRCDFDRTEIVDSRDYSFLALNYSESSPVTVTAERTGGEDGETAEASSTESLSAYESLFVSVLIDSGTQKVDAIDAYLNFDTNCLEIIGIAPGDALPVLLLNSIDNQNGNIDLSMGRNKTNDVPNGTITLTTIELAVKKATEETAITFSTKSPRVTTIAYLGQSINLDPTKCKIAVK